MLLKEYDRPTGCVRKTTTHYGVFKCDICDREFERSMKFRRSKHDSCSRKCMNRNRVHSRSWNEAIAQAMKSEKNHFYGKRHTDESRKRISDSLSGIHLSDATRKKLSERLAGERNPFYGKHHSDETRRRMSESRVLAIQEGRASIGPRGKRGTYFSIKTGREENYDSFFELIRMRLLDADDNVIDWTKRHSISIAYTWNGLRRYVPDFVIYESDRKIIEEVKGFEDAEKLKAKLEALRSFCDVQEYQVSYLDFERLDQLVRQKWGKSIASMRKNE